MVPSLLLAVGATALGYRYHPRSHFLQWEDGFLLGATSADLNDGEADSYFSGVPLRPEHRERTGSLPREDREEWSYTSVEEAAAALGFSPAVPAPEKGLALEEITGWRVSWDGSVNHLSIRLLYTGAKGRALCVTTEWSPDMEKEDASITSYMVFDSGEAAPYHSRGGLTYAVRTQREEDRDCHGAVAMEGAYSYSVDSYGLPLSRLEGVLDALAY